MINWPKLSRDIGGQYLLDRQSLLLMAPFLIVVSVLSASAQGSDSELVNPSVTERYFGLILANLASLFICFLYLEIVDRTLFKSKLTKPVSLVAVIVFGASLGFVKGYTTGLFSWVFGSELVLSVAVSNRIIQTTLLGLWTIPLLALVTSTFAKYQAEREMLLAEKVEFALRNPVDPHSSQSTTDLREFIARSKSELAKLREAPCNIESSAIVAIKLRDLVENGLRPISHKIWDSESGKTGRFSLPAIATLALSQRPFPLLMISIGFTLGLLPINLVAYPFSEALARTALTVAVTTTVFALSRRLRPKSIHLLVALFLMANLLAAFAGPIITDLVLDKEIDYSDFAVWIALFLWLAQLSFFASVASEVLNSRADIRKQLLELVGEAGMDSQVRMAISKLNNRELAQYVHGNLQNRLLSAALKLEQDDLSPEEVIVQLNEVEALLDGTLEDYRSSSGSSLNSQLQEITKRWAGFVKLEINNQLSSSLLSKETVKAIVQVVSEAVSNSVRHGLAKSVSVAILTSSNELDDFVYLNIKDDGLGPRSGKAGLGTELFAAISGGSWSMTQLPEGGTELNLRIKTT